MGAASEALADEKNHPGRSFKRFCPKLSLGYQQQLFQLLDQIENAAAPIAKEMIAAAIVVIDKRLETLASWGLAPGDLGPTLNYSAALRVLRDLQSQGWSIRSDDQGPILKLPSQSALGEDPEASKRVLRSSFSFAREEQLRKPSTTRFINSMERRGISQLFASGVNWLEPPGEGS